jgi:hypothetical protein
VKIAYSGNRYGRAAVILGRSVNYRRVGGRRGHSRRGHLGAEWEGTFISGERAAALETENDTG